MASEEYVSVSSQRDAEKAMLALERRELAESPRAEVAELARIYEAKGLQPGLARQVPNGLPPTTHWPLTPRPNSASTPSS
jgi:vacuolar iron transporter family protein